MNNEIKFDQIEYQLKNKFNASNIWIPIYQNNYKTETVRQSWFMTFSTDKEKSLSTENWDDFFGTNYCKGKGDFGDIKYYLVIERSGNKHLNKRIEIAEDFRLFYNLYQENGEYFFDDDDDPQKVIRYNDNDKIYEIKYSYLLEYISYKKIYAVLNFELDFYHCVKQESEKQLRDNNFTAIKNAFIGHDGSLTTRFMGKVILDYSKNLPKANNEVKFIIGKDNNDNYLYAKITGCDIDILTGVCFDRKVLKKYYDKPELYHVAYSNVFCDNKWSLDGHNEESFREIIVSTHNLSKLPYKEQMYWSGFSKISEDSEMRTKDIWSTSDLITAIENFKYYWSKRYEKVLLKEPSEENSYISNQIYVPVSDELSEFYIVVKNMVIFCVDAINTALLRQFTEEKYISKDKDGKISYKTRISLLDYFRSKNIDFEKEDEFLKHLIAIRDHNSHLKSNDYDNAVKYFDITNRGTQQCIIDISKQLHDIFIKLALSFSINI